MIKFITVLNSDLNLSYWRAVQWGYTLDSVDENDYYTAGTNMNSLKNEGDVIVKTKVITELVTRKRNSAAIIQLDKKSTDTLKLANNKATKSFLKLHNL